MLIPLELGLEEHRAAGTVEQLRSSWDHTHQGTGVGDGILVYATLTTSTQRRSSAERSSASCTPARRERAPLLDSEVALAFRRFRVRLAPSSCVRIDRSAMGHRTVPSHYAISLGATLRIVRLDEGVSRRCL